jgi:cytochrome c-type protein NapC
VLAALKRYWNIIRRPSVHFSLGFLAIGGFVGGIVFWGAFNTACAPSARTATYRTTGP